MGGGDPICVIRTVTVEVRPFGLVDEAFAWIEGEGDRSLPYWREEHARFFESEGRPVDDDTLVVLEIFELLWSPLPEPPLVIAHTGSRQSPLSSR